MTLMPLRSTSLWLSKPGNSVLKPKTDIESIDSDSSYCYSGKYKMVIAPKTFVRYRNLLDGIDHTTVEIFSFKLWCKSRS